MNKAAKQSGFADNRKLIRLQVDKSPAKTRQELYNLNTDPMEVLDVAGQYPEKVKELGKLLDKAHVSSELYPFKTERK